MIDFLRNKLGSILLGAFIVVVAFLGYQFYKGLRMLQTHEAVLVNICKTAPAACGIAQQAAPAPTASAPTPSTGGDKK